MRGIVSVGVATVIAIGIGVGVLAAIGMTPQPLQILGATGVGNAQFGEQKAVAVEEITRLIGPPTASQTISGCGPRYSEVEWGDLAVEFRLGIFNGYRYLDGGLERLAPFATVAELESLPVTPRLTGRDGITLGSSLGRVRSVYGPLHVVGTSRSESADGLIFYDDSQHGLVGGRSAKILEIKTNETCGDY